MKISREIPAFQVVGRKVFAKVSSALLRPEYSDRFENAIQTRDQEKGLIVVYTHPSFKDPSNMAEVFAENAPNEKIVSPISHHQYGIVTKFLALATGVDLYPVSNQSNRDKMGKRAPSKEQSHEMKKRYFDKATEQLSNGGIVAIAEGAKRKSVLENVRRTDGKRPQNPLNALIKRFDPGKVEIGLVGLSPVSMVENGKKTKTRIEVGPVIPAQDLLMIAKVCDLGIDFVVRGFLGLLVEESYSQLEKGTTQKIFDATEKLLQTNQLSKKGRIALESLVNRQLQVGEK